MRITLKTLKRSPTGRESVRERDFEGAVSFGRDASSDVQMEALSVALNHGVLRLSDDGVASFETASSQSVVINNRLKTGRQGPLAQGAIIKIGPYQITLEGSSETADLVLLLEEPQADEAAIVTPSETRVFGLGRALPGKRFMSWAFIALILGVFAFLPMHVAENPKGKVAEAVPFQTDASWNSGPLSLMHSNLQNDCAACHAKPWEAVQDTTCVDCHEGTGDHAAKTTMAKATPAPEGFDAHLAEVSLAFSRPLDRCSSCHVEHNTRAHIMPADQGTCGDCHMDLKSRLPETDLLNVADFGNAHPQFWPEVIVQPSYTEPTVVRISLDDNPKGFSGLKFPHDIHMKSTGGVAKMASTLDARYGFADGVDCADCHREEAGGALYEPVRMTSDCAMCHSIVFEDDEGYPRTLRHGEPREVIASMKDFYDAKALGNIRDAEMNSTTRRRPGRAASMRELNRRELAFKQSEQRTIAKVDAIFSEGGSCYDCHVIDRPDDITTMDFRVRPISVSDAFYPRSPFNHAQHEIEGLDCASCHAAETSSTSNDILLPKIGVCRDCHIGEDSYRAGLTGSGPMSENAFPTNCLTCHSYHSDGHDPDNPVMQSAAVGGNPHITSAQK